MTPSRIGSNTTGSDGEHCAWDTLKSISLVESVIKEGCNWVEVASRFKDHITAKDCEVRFSELIKENNVSISTKLPADISKRKALVYPIMESLNQARILEIKSIAAEKRSIFKHIMQEISLIETGRYNHLFLNNEPEVSEKEGRMYVDLKLQEPEPLSRSTIPNSPIEDVPEPDDLISVNVPVQDNEDIDMQDASQVDPLNESGLVSESLEEVAANPQVSPATVLPPKHTEEEPPSILLNAQTAVQGALSAAKTFLFGLPSGNPVDSFQTQSISAVEAEQNQQSTYEIPLPSSPTKSVNGRPRSMSPIKIPHSDVTDNESGTETEYTDGPERKRVKGDERYKTWRRTALMIWNKIADHRAGNRFLKPVKNDAFLKAVKKPLCLEQVKARIRDGTTRTTAEFHRDVLHVLINAVMFNAEDSELYKMALEMMDYADVEMKSLLIYSQANSSSNGTFMIPTSPTKEY